MGWQVSANKHIKEHATVMTFIRNAWLSCFLQTHKVGNVDIIASFVLPWYISSFLLYWDIIMLENVKFYINGYERITFQGCIFLWRICEKLLYLRIGMSCFRLAVRQIYRRIPRDRYRSVRMRGTPTHTSGYPCYTSGRQTRSSWRHSHSLSDCCVRSVDWNEPICSTSSLSCIQWWVQKAGFFRYKQSSLILTGDMPFEFDCNQHATFVRSLRPLIDFIEGYI